MSGNSHTADIGKHMPADVGHGQSLIDKRKRLEAETAERIAELLRERNGLMEEVETKTKRLGAIAEELKALGFVNKRPRAPKVAAGTVQATQAAE